MRNRYELLLAFFQLKGYVIVFETDRSIVLHLNDDLGNSSFSIDELEKTIIVTWTYPDSKFDIWEYDKNLNQSEIYHSINSKSNPLSKDLELHKIRKLYFDFENHFNQHMRFKRGTIEVYGYRYAVNEWKEKAKLYFTPNTYKLPAGIIADAVDDYGVIRMKELGQY